MAPGCDSGKCGLEPRTPPQIIAVPASERCSTEHRRIDKAKRREVTPRKSISRRPSLWW